MMYFIYYDIYYFDYTIYDIYIFDYIVILILLCKVGNLSLVIAYMGFVNKI